MIFTTSTTSMGQNKVSDWSLQVTELIDASILKQHEESYAARGSGVGQVAKKRIGSGYIGTVCGRALAYRYHKANKEERTSVVSPGELQRHALAGHWTEEMMASWLRLSGFDLLTHRPGDPTKQIGWFGAVDPETGQARMAGEVDGVIVAGPLGFVYPIIWESKKGTDKKWTKFSKNGVRKADEVYFGQLQINMAMLGIEQSLFTMLNLDNMKIYAEVVLYDPQAAQALSDRAAMVISSRKPEEIPRITKDRNDFRCQFCDYRGSCWSNTPTSSVPNQPSWWLK